MVKFQKLIQSLTPHEKKIIPYLEEENINQICKKSNLDKISVFRSLKYLKKKKIINLDINKTKIIEIGVNGALYRKKGLPERRLLNLLAEKRIIPLNEAKKQSNLSDNEFKASLGALKRKALIQLKNGRIILDSGNTEISRKTPEEKLLEALPLKQESLEPEQKFALKNLQSRKDIVRTNEKKEIRIAVTELGKEIIKHGIKEENLIEEITPETLKKGTWKGKKFRRYDLSSPCPSVYGGRRHFVNQAIDYAKKIWTEMGFKEMQGDMVQSSFWNFDALFTPQDHPVREMQDTFFIDHKAELPDKKLVRAVKECHEKGIKGSEGWGGEWDEEKAKKMVLRTHTTCLSAQTLSKLKEKDLPVKFFAVGTNFRNETIDWKHGFEFLQTEGIVVDPNVNFKNLLGYLKQFAEKMGYKKVRFRPAYFPYTEPSVEGDVWHEEKKQWIEVFAAGIFRPEVTVPLLGKEIPVLAWGPGFSRMIMNYYGIKDLRELNKNDLTKLRKMKFWVK